MLLHFCHLDVCLNPQKDGNWTSSAEAGLAAINNAAICRSVRSLVLSKPLEVSGALDVLDQLFKEYQDKVPGGAPPVLCLDQADVLRSWTSEAEIRDKKAVMAFLVHVRVVSKLRVAFKLSGAHLLLYLAHFPSAGHDELTAASHSTICLRAYTDNLAGHNHANNIRNILIDIGRTEDLGQKHAVYF
jgi:hypothetical protein